MRPRPTAAASAREPALGIDPPVQDAGAFDFYFDTPRHALLDLLGGEPPGRVLELGCGCGANLVELRARYPACETWGVERHQAAAERARGRPGIDRLIVGDALDPGVTDLEPGSFDLIVLSHVLEHFAEPDEVLERCRLWLRPGGQILVALPNVRHYSVLVDLVVKGEFRYRDDGILDRTHLRFFTRRSAQRMIRAHGFELRRVRPDIAGRRSRVLDALSLGLAREFTAFAFNLLAARP